MTRRAIRGASGIIALLVIGGVMFLMWSRSNVESLQTNSEAEANAAAQVAPSTEYAWVDRNQGVARIPITRAMDIIAEKGLPWGEVPEPAAPPVAAGAAADAGGAPAKPAGPKLDPASVQAGQEVFVKRCLGCHSEGSKYPPLANRYGSKVELEGGGQAIFDEAYIRESITDPGAKIALNYKVMPKLPNLTDEDVHNLAVYVHSLTK